jgi:hypothetical protein
MTLEKNNIGTFPKWDLEKNYSKQDLRELVSDCMHWKVYFKKDLEKLLEIHFDRLVYKGMPCRCMQCEFIRILLGIKK